MQTVVIKKKQIDGSFLEATFAPELGMNLISLKKDKLELLDVTTEELFFERRAGLGALIGPHFYHQKETLLPPPCPADLFPHIPKFIAKGQKDFFSHGIARYVPWQHIASEEKITAKISSVDIYKSYLLSELEGLNFYMTYEAEILEDRFRIKIFSNSDTQSLIGLHYYYALYGQSFVDGDVASYYYDKGEKKPLEENWKLDSHKIHLDTKQELDFGFHPILKDSIGTLTLTTGKYVLKQEIQPLDGSEYSVQIYHPIDKNFICIEPISAANPRGDCPKQGHLVVDLFITLI